MIFIFVLYQNASTSRILGPSQLELKWQEYGIKKVKPAYKNLNRFAFLLPSDSLQIPTVHVVFKYLIKHCQHVQLLQIQCTHALMLEISF
jgi:hypothetical protein